ncbi:MAG: NUDIX domain-containing protein, partial [Bacteroidales bacterium]|nr:NUDIX domain-containing protein [Bacteroidales bacterium]
MFEASATLSRIYIPTDDIEATYKRICGEFKEVNAAGGLVSNRRGDYLLISRDGLWDLPKGHQEPGEDISVTAIREVQEETGVDKLLLRDLICIT